jgi:DNA-binding CsgD family transcriptional regulator
MSPAALRHLPDMIAALGTAHFGRELIGLLNEIFGAEHCTFFRFDPRGPREVIAVSRDGTDTAHRQFELYISGAYWRGDPSIAEALRTIGSAGLSLYRTDIRAMPEGDFRERLYERTQIRERVLLCGATADMTIGLSILRPQERGIASDAELSELGALSGTLIALLGKHAGMIDSRADFSLALTSLEEIEATLEDSGLQLPKREAEVCARILYGISTAGIALGLGIGEETVMTYRKRAYHRLGIGTQRELLLWYIGEWSARHARLALRRH